MFERLRSGAFREEVAAGRLDDYLEFLENIYMAVAVNAQLLEEEADLWFNELMTGPLEKTRLVMNLMGYLVVKTEIYDRRLESSTDPREFEAILSLHDYFEGMLHGKSLVEGLYVYCDNNYQTEHETKRWGVMAEIIKRMLPLETQIKNEIKQRTGELWFMPSEYAAYRRKGLQPEEIGYDLCHSF